MVNRLAELHHRLLGNLQLPPDVEVEDAEDEEGPDAGHDDPGPGAVEDDVVPAEPELGGPHVGDLVIAAPTAGEVHAVAHGLGLEELPNVEDHGYEDAGEDVHEGSCHLTGV